MRVLVADDDLISRLMLESAVTGLGHDCVVATDGDEAWQLFGETRPDVLITDWMMPGLDGPELCRRVRAGEPTTYTYIVIVTGLSDRQHVLDGMGAGADDYLAKPIDPFDLETRLIAASRVTSLHRELAESQAELARAAVTDALTQLRNRRTMVEDLNSLHARAARSGSGYSLALCDVDFFKLYNDTMGHQAGDEVLRAVAAALAGHVRAGDTVYRFGGEEFLVVLPDQSLPGVMEAAERLRQGVKDLSLPHPRGTTDGIVTVSIGIASWAGVGSSPEDVLAAADAALYEAKAAGRDRVEPASVDR